MARVVIDTHPACPACGAVMADPELHQQFHDGLREICRHTALEAAITILPGPEPDFMSQVKTEPLNGKHLRIRLTHEPTGITVTARDRSEGTYKLRKAFTDHARRQYDLQEAERRQQRKTAKETRSAT
jgi:hypothetical protein